MAALVVKLLLVPLATRDEPVLIFFAAVMIAATFGGFGPGLLATLMASAFDAVFFMAPFGRVRLDSADQGVRLIVFVLEGGFISLLCARLTSACLRAEASSAEAQELEGKLLDIGEAEQRRIGHDLHDGLGQQLTGLAMMTRRLQEKLASAGVPAAEDASRICELARESIEWTRDLCRSLSPPSLASSGLPEGLRELAARAEAILRVRCECELHAGVTDLPLPVSVHLYRIAQESISNAVRHGHATKILLRLAAGDGHVLLEIQDNGVGLSASPQNNDGMGLRTMRYRARMIGATVQMRPLQGGGTIVSCLLPITTLEPANQ